MPKVLLKNNNWNWGLTRICGNGLCCKPWHEVSRPAGKLKHSNSEKQGVWVFYFYFGVNKHRRRRKNNEQHDPYYQAKNFPKKLGRCRKLLRDWKCKSAHSIRNIETVEKILGIHFEDDEKKPLNKPSSDSALSITPYYLSLVDAKDYKNDPCLQTGISGERELYWRL
jgi:hypothetical protein